jgi:hypothetical protein
MILEDYEPDTPNLEAAAVSASVDAGADSAFELSKPIDPSFLHVLPVLFIRTKNPQCGTINQILDQNYKWRKNIKEPCSGVNCHHDRSDTCYDLDSFDILYNK